MEDATPSPISAIISLCNMGYLWKNVPSRPWTQPVPPHLNIVCDGEAHMKAL